MHYPFENKEYFEKTFPADFIAEGIDQTRGWFYTLTVLAAALFDKPAFKNLICNGLVLAEDGQKMSKRKKNYPPPEHIVNSCAAPRRDWVTPQTRTTSHTPHPPAVHRYGADALRLYLINSPVVRADNLRFKEAGVKQVVRDLFLPWYHAYRLFVQCARAQLHQTGTAFAPDEKRALASKNIMDKWILAAFNGLVDFARKEMEAYRYETVLSELTGYRPTQHLSNHALPHHRLYTVVPRLVEMVEQLTNWYLRMNKERFEGGRGEDERRDSLSVAFEVLMGLCRMMAPLTPFLTELIYQNLRRAVPDAPESVHFLEIPQVVAAAIDPQIEEDMKMMQTLIEKGRAIRDRHGVSLRVPLPTITLVHCSQASLTAIEKLRDYVMEELNVREVKTALVTDADARALVKLKCLPNHTLLGKRFGKTYGNVQKSIRALTHEALAAFLSSGSLTLDGEAFGADDILVQLEYVGEKGARDADTTDGGLVLLDLRPSAAMLAEANAREVCAHVQKMRKDAGLRKEDVVEVGYECAAPADGGAAALPATLAEQAEYIAGRIGRSLLPLAACPPRAVRLHTEVHDAFKVLAIGDGGAIAQRAEPLTLVLLRGCAFVDAAKLAALVPDAAARDDVVNYVHCRDLAAVRADVAASGGVLRVPLGGQTVELRHKVHLFLSSAEAKAAGALA